jgi:hypothetical protein
MKRLVLFALIASMFAVPMVMGRIPTNVTVINEDGYIDNDPPLYTRENTTSPIEVGAFLGAPDFYHGYIEFNISGIPDAAIVEQVELVYMMQDNGTNVFTINDMQHQPSLSSNLTVFGDAANGTQYNAGWNNVWEDVWETLTLTGAAADLQANLAVDWFAVGFEPSGIGQIDELYSSESANAPLLIVNWHLATDFSYVISGPFFENGNLTGVPVTVTAAIAEGNEEFVVDGSPVSQYFPVEPLIFYWDLGGGATRRIYSAGSENFTVTIPDDTFDTHTFTVRDFTNKLSRGDAYLEAWRIVATNDTLIERMIIDVHNQVPMNLVTGATYTLIVRFYDNTTTTWGFFVPGQTLTTTIVLRGVEITDQAYLVGNFINVEITRPIATQITVDYQTTRNTTVWSNVTVIIRNGALVAFQSYAVEGYTLNVAGLDADTSYTVLVEGDHSLQSEWAYSDTFDATETYPDVPNIEDIFPMAALDASNLIAWVFTLVGGATFSLIDKRIGLIVMSALASFFSIFGFADWNFYLLSLSWFFSIVVYLGGADR